MNISKREHKARTLKKKIFRLLKDDPLESSLAAICEMPPRRAVNALFALLLSTDPVLRWRAVSAFGVLVANLADRDMEGARVILRRLMWQLNDESGGIGWGCPEAMGEILASHRGLADEYSSVLISYINEEGNYLEYAPLRRGAVWGIARVAQNAPERMRKAVPHLLACLGSEDSTVRGISAWALGLLEAREARANLEALLDDTSPVEIYRDLRWENLQIKDLAKEALVRMSAA